MNGKMKFGYFGIEKDEAVKPSKVEIYKEPSYVEVVDNRIYFYSDVYAENILKLNKSIRETAIQLERVAIQQENQAAKIFLHVHSYGGSLLAGFAAMDEVIGCRVPIVSIIDGAVASAASFFTVSAKHRIIRPHAYVLIHQLSSIYWGKYYELRDEMDNLDRFMYMIRKVYSEYSKVPCDKLDEILKHDLWFDAKTALEYGIVDEIR
jgi:ATP-dependent protease ClpP protease subunit